MVGSPVRPVCGAHSVEAASQNVCWRSASTREEAEASEHGAYRQIFGLRAVHLMAFFILIYVGYVFHARGSPELHVEHMHHLVWKLHSAAGLLHTSSKSEVVGRPPVTFPPAFFGGLTFRSRRAAVGEQEGMRGCFLRNRGHGLTGSKIGERRAIFVYSLLALG
jgi:hypothetical protein